MSGQARPGRSSQATGLNQKHEQSALWEGRIKNPRQCQGSLVDLTDLMPITNCAVHGAVVLSKYLFGTWISLQSPTSPQLNPSDPPADPGPLPCSSASLSLHIQFAAGRPDARRPFPMKPVSTQTSSEHRNPLSTA